MRRLVGLAAIVLVVLACVAAGGALLVTTTKRDTPAYVPALAPRPLPGAATLPPPPPPAAASFVIHLAAFAKGKLDECNDLVFTPPPGTTREAVDTFSVDLTSKTKKTGAIALQKPCADALAGKAPLASCIVPPSPVKLKGLVGWSVAATVYYYNTATVVDDDTFMRECLESHGNWMVSEGANTETFRQRVSDHHKMLERLTPP